MIGFPTGAHIWLVAGVTDLRRGFTGMSTMVQTSMEQDPFAGHIFVFRGRRGHLIKLLRRDGDGMCLFAERLERGRFVWPQVTEGTVSLTGAQLSMRLEVIDWRRPQQLLRISPDSTPTHCAQSSWRSMSCWRRATPRSSF